MMVRMKLNAVKFATGLIALLVVTLLYELASDGESLLASSFGMGVLLVGFVFRKLIFKTVHRVVEGTLTSQAEKVFGVTAEPGEPFDAQAAIERHLKGSDGEQFDVDAAFDRYMARRQAGEVSPPPAPSETTASRPAFGRKGL